MQYAEKQQNKPNTPTKNSNLQINLTTTDFLSPKFLYLLKFIFSFYIELC